MFGYVKPQKSELLVREFDAYRGIYCSLCKSLGKDYGFASRLALNYDCTFYALVLISARSDSAPIFQKGRCVVNPLKPCLFCKENSTSFHWASALTVILLYHKVLDDIHDSKPVKKAMRMLIFPFVKHIYHKAVKNFPKIGEVIEEAMAEQRKLEESPVPGLDRSAEPTAQMMKRIMEVSSEEFGSSVSRVFSSFGYYLGRWIYLIDAADDLEDDLQENAFNPLAARFHLDRNSPPESIWSARAYVNDVLNQTLSQLGAAFNLMETNAMGPIVKNVIFLGLPQMQKELLFEKEKTNV